MIGRGMKRRRYENLMRGVSMPTAEEVLLFAEVLRCDPVSFWARWEHWFAMLPRKGER